MHATRFVFPASSFENSPNYYVYSHFVFIFVFLKYPEEKEGRRQSSSDRFLVNVKPSEPQCQSWERKRKHQDILDFSVIIMVVTTNCEQNPPHRVGR